MTLDDAPFHGFQTTRWSTVMAARGPSTPESAAALEALCRDYWLPIYSFFRRKGVGVEEAKDLTQEFITREFVEQNLLHHIQRREGVKFRQFLRHCLNHDFVDEIRKKYAQKRGSGVPGISIDAHRAETWLARWSVTRNCPPEDVLDYAIARTVLMNALQRLKQAYTTDEEMARFRMLEPCLVSDAGATGYAELGKQLGISEGGIKTAVLRLRRRYFRLLQEEVAAIVTDQDDILDELRYLLKVYSRGPMDASVFRAPGTPLDGTSGSSVPL